MSRSIYGLGPRQLARRILVGGVAAFLFVLSLQLIGESTAAISPVIERVMRSVVTSDMSALGLGWLGAYVMLNGSTVAALAIGLFSTGLTTETETFLLIAGSRLGAALLVVLLGGLEYVRGEAESLRESSSIGVLSFLVALAIYLPAIGLGLLVLRTGDPAFLEVSLPPGARGVLDVLFGPVVAELVSRLPPFWLFLLALFLLVLSLKVFDLAFTGLGRRRVEQRTVEDIDRWLSFGAGAGITLLTASVSLSIGILVPLYNRRFFTKRSALLPYIMGANVTTLVDTAIAAAVLNTPEGMKLVLVLGGAAGLVTLLYLLGYDSFLQLVENAEGRILKSRRALGTFLVALAATPLLLLML